MNSKLFYIFVFIFFVFITNESSAAEVYKIKIKSLDSFEVHEAICEIQKDSCFSTFKLPIQSESYSGQIDAAVGIKDGFADVRFKIAKQSLSTTGQGWGTFYERLESFSGEPQVIKLYYPNPTIKNDGRYSVPLVVRPPNKYMATVAIYLEPIGQDK